MLLNAEEKKSKMWFFSKLVALIWLYMLWNKQCLWQSWNLPSHRKEARKEEGREGGREGKNIPGDCESGQIEAEALSPLRQWKKGKNKNTNSEIWHIRKINICTSARAGPSWIPLPIWSISSFLYSIYPLWLHVMSFLVFVTSLIMLHRFCLSINCVPHEVIRTPELFRY